MLRFSINFPSRRPRTDGLESVVQQQLRGRAARLAGGPAGQPVVDELAVQAGGRRRLPVHLDRASRYVGDPGQPRRRTGTCEGQRLLQGRSGVRLEVTSEVSSARGQRRVKGHVRVQISSNVRCPTRYQARDQSEATSDVSSEVRPEISSEVRPEISSEVSSEVRQEVGSCHVRDLA